MFEQVQEYYGKTLQTSADLQTNACCTDVSAPTYLRQVLADIHDEVTKKYYGCGLVLPPALQGAKVLDLGCGAGRDCFVLSKLVGQTGQVVGIDMTQEQLAVAQEYVGYHTQLYGYNKPNVSFQLGNLEQLGQLDLLENSFDIIVSNCVINLVPNKEAVLAQAYALLKPGGEMYFSDVYADRRIPSNLQDDPVLYGECLSGALYWNDFQQLAKQVGFADPRLVEDRPITVENTKLLDKVAPIRFFSATYRLFKLDQLEPACEDYGQAVIYKGTVPHHERRFVLDKHHVMEQGKVFPVCGNTYRMLHDSRFNQHFEFIGAWDMHYGIFDGCGTSLPFTMDNGSEPSACC